jgi:hypothetical protein
MDDNLRFGESTETLHKLKVTDETITRLSNDLAHWKMDVDVEVVPDKDKLGLKITVTKNNGQGFFIIVNAAEVEYYTADIDTLVSKLTERAFDLLFKEQIRNVITSPVTKAVENIKFIGSKA